MPFRCKYIITLYADEALIFIDDFDCARIKLRLEPLLSIILDWSNCNHNLNVQKTKFCIYGYRSHVAKFQDRVLWAGEKRISRCTQYRYLGVDLDECMSLTTNFNSIFKQYSYKIFQIW